MTAPTFVQNWKKTGANDDNITLSCSGIVSGIDHALVVMGLRWRGPNTPASYFTTCTVGGNSATRVNQINGSYIESSVSLSIFFILNPPSGTQNVVLSGASGHYGQMFVAEFSDVSGYGESGTADGATSGAISKSLSGLSLGRDLVIAVMGGGDINATAFSSPLTKIDTANQDLVDARYDVMFEWGYGEPTTDPDTFELTSGPTTKMTLLVMEIVGPQKGGVQAVWLG